MTKVFQFSDKTNNRKENGSAGRESGESDGGGGGHRYSWGFRDVYIYTLKYTVSVCLRSLHPFYTVTFNIYGSKLLVCTLYSISKKFATFFVYRSIHLISAFLLLMDSV